MFHRVVFICAIPRCSTFSPCTGQEPFLASTENSLLTGKNTGISPFPDPVMARFALISHSFDYIYLSEDVRSKQGIFSERSGNPIPSYPWNRHSPGIFIGPFFQVR